MKFSKLFLLLLFGTTCCRDLPIKPLPDTLVLNKPLPEKPAHHAPLPVVLDKQYLEKHCYDCHDDDEPEGEFRLDDISSDLTDLDTFRKWSDIYRRVKQGDMPPKKKPAPEVSQKFTDALYAKLHETEKERISKEGRVAWRRLSVKEYNNTLRELLKYPKLNVLSRLPSDTPLKHFDKEEDSLSLVREHLDAYLNIANVALKGSYDPAVKTPDMSPYTGYVRVPANLIQRRGQTYWDKEQEKK